MAVTSYRRNKNLDEMKKHSRTSPDVQFNKFVLTKEKLDLKRSMIELQKSFLNKSDQRNKKTANQNTACKKTNSEKWNLVETKKLGLD